jgi:hypothetical protein
VGAEEGTPEEALAEGAGNEGGGAVEGSEGCHDGVQCLRDVPPCRQAQRSVRVAGGRATKHVMPLCYVTVCTSGDTHAAGGLGDGGP